MPSPRAAQELDLLLQEGRADDPALLEGLVHLYANDLFRFAWENLAETDNPTIRRLRTRRAVTQALLTALTHLHRFQEQPSTFLWLLRLTRENAPRPPADLPQQVAFLACTYTTSPEDLAYILKIPERHPALKALDPAQPPAPPTPAPGSADRPAAFTPLTPAEATALIETLHTAHPASVPANPRFVREFGMLALALVLIIAFVRVSPNRVIYLPTPVPTATHTPLPPSVWEMTPVPLPGSPDPFLPDVFYEPENPYLVWRQTHVLHGPSTFYRTLVASPTDPLLAVGNNQNQIMLWDLTTFTVTQTLGGHEGGVQSLAFSPDGSLLASGGGEGVVQLWEMPAGHLIQVLDGHPNIINGLAFSPDGQTLAVAAGKELWVWQVNSGARMAVYGNFEQTVTGLSYSPDGNFLAMSEVGGRGWIIRAEDGYPLLSVRTNNLSVMVRRMIFSPTEQTLVVNDEDNMPQVIRLKGDKAHLEVERLKSLMNTGENSYHPAVRDFVFSPDGRIAGASVQGGAVYLWDTATWTPLQAPLQATIYDDTAHPMTFGFNSALLAVGQDNGEILIWQLVDVSEEVARLETPRFYERLDRDLYTWTYTMPDEETIFWGDTALDDLDRLSEQAGFPVKIPMIALLGGDHQFSSFNYEPMSGLVFASAYAENQPGLLWSFSLMQRKAVPGDWLSPEDSLFTGTIDKIGLTALVEPVAIGTLSGELVSGSWVYMEEENFQMWGDTPQSGRQFKVVNRWGANSYNLSLRWMDGEIMFTLQVYSDPYTLGPLATREIMLDLAQTVYDPAEIDLPWYTEPLFIPVQAGDTCRTLAARFYTTPEIIRALNHLPPNCPLTVGQRLIIPTPAEPVLTTDLDCDGTEETLVMMREGADTDVITGVAVEYVAADSLIPQRWKFTAAEMGVASLNPPEVFSLGDCKQMIVITGGTPTASFTRIYRWNGDSVTLLLSGPGRPYSADYSVAALPQDPDVPFVIPLIQYVPSTHPAAGPCPNEVIDFTWNGFRFDGGEKRMVLGECAGN